MTDPHDSLSEKPQIELVADEDWKERVKAEDAKLDEELNQQAKLGPAAEAEVAEATQEPVSARTESRTEVDAQQLPPPGIDSISQMFVTQAMLALGLIPGPDGKIERQLPLARHFIDLLGVLEEKTKGNLSPDEARLLDYSLHELRMLYVQQSKGS